MRSTRPRATHTRSLHPHGAQHGRRNPPLICELLLLLRLLHARMAPSTAPPTPALPLECIPLATMTLQGYSACLFPSRIHRSGKYAPAPLHLSIRPHIHFVFGDGAINSLHQRLMTPGDTLRSSAYGRDALAATSTIRPRCLPLAPSALALAPLACRQRSWRSVQEHEREFRAP